MAPTSYLRGAGLLVLWGQVDITKIDEEGLNDWWTNEHLPERLNIPGFVHARRYFAPNTTSPDIRKYLTLYEVATLDVLTSPGYMTSLEGPTAKTTKYMAGMGSQNRSACNVLYSAPRPEFVGLSHGVGGSIAHIVCTPPTDAGTKEHLKEWVTGPFALSILTTHHTMLALHFVQRDETATQSGTKTKSYVAVGFSSSEKTEVPKEQWIILVEMSTSPSAPDAKKRMERIQPFIGQLEEKSVAVGSVEIYDLLSAVSE